MKAYIVAAVTLLLLTCALGLFLGTVFQSPSEHRTLVVTGVVAFVVQVVAFAIARRSAPSNLIAGWGVGVALRMIVLAVFALVLVKPLGLVSTAALVGLATYFFVSTLVEPLLLRL